jgi:prepilin-type N-terminal cleavage/methylation domain-containing protein
MVKKNKGFTLIEILVVMGIVAILAAIVLIAINPARQFAQARNTQRESNVNAILNAIGQYSAENEGVLPTSMSDVDTAVPVSNTDADICDDLVPEYLPALPVDPESTIPGVPVEEADCIAAYDTEYTVAVDSNGRVSVCAPNAADESALTDPEAICIKR